MPRTKSVQKFKDDSVDLEARILSAIGSVGPRNVALISRMTGAHQETIRYKIKKRFANRGFRFQAEVDFSKLGLTLHWGTFEVSPLYYKSAPGLFRALNKAGYLMHFSKMLPQGHYVALFALPEGKGSEYSKLLEALKQRKIISSYQFNEVLVEQHKPMDPGFYNFQSDRWEVDWQKVRNLPGIPLGATKSVPAQEADEIDMLIIKELQLDALQHVVGIAKKVKVHEKTMEYHYRTHIVKKGLIPRYRVRWMRDAIKTLAHSTAFTRLTFRGLDPQELKRVQRTVSKIPYLWAEDLLKNGTYIATLSIPMVDFVEAGSFLNDELQFLGPKVDFGYMKAGDSDNFTIPYEMFVDGEWKFDAKRIESAVLKELSAGAEK
jgi:DNA-binding Lrp family transcriptional regulator